MENENMSLGQWVVTLIIASIPCVNFVMLLVWAFGANTNPSKKTWAQATLIIAVVVFVLCAIYFAIFGASLAASLPAAY